ncbi:hypothetical protein FRB96_008672 [Tulasnella sp. 330]|nr:hypothetical protein FRB96_008672 [Tulasnella sp. 330]
MALRRESRDPTEDWLVFQDYERTAGSDVEGSRSPDSYFHTTSQWLEPQSATSSSPSSSPSANSSASSASLRPEYQGSKASSSTARLEILDALEIPLEAPVAEKFSNLHAPTPCPPQPPRLRKGVVKAEVTLKIPGSYPWHAEVSPKATGPASPESDLEIDWDLLRRVLEETEAQRRALPPNASKPSKPEDKPTPAIVLTPTNIDKTITLKAKVPEPPKRRTSTCGICQEPFYISSDPLLASRSKSNEVFGLSFACPGTHKYCLECLTSYVRTKLDPDDETHGGEKFAVRCPECPRDEVWRMGDWTAVKLLDGELLEAWYFQRLLASLDYVSRLPEEFLEDHYSNAIYVPNTSSLAPILTSAQDAEWTSAFAVASSLIRAGHATRMHNLTPPTEPYTSSPKDCTGVAAHDARSSSNVPKGVDT